MFERAGRARYVVPVLIVILLALMMGLMFWPMAHMRMSNLPFAIVSLDKGAETMAGEVNLGDEMLKMMTGEESEEDSTTMLLLGSMSETDTEGTSSSASTMSLFGSSDSEDSMIEWHVLDNEEELNEGLDNLEYFGALIIPEDYTAMMLEVQMGTGSAPSMTMLIDNAKSPMIANMMRMSIASSFAEMGLDVDVEVIHNEVVGTESSSSDDESETFSLTSMYATMMGQMLYIMPLVMTSMMGGLFLSRILRRKGATSRGQSWRRMVVQLCYVLGLSLVVSLMVLFLLYVFIGLEVPVLESVLFMWFASFCLMLCALALSDVTVVLGGILMFCCMALCMSSAMLPPEMLPEFWADWIYPWAPQHYIGTGMREIMYLGEGVWNSASLPLLIYGIVGAVVFVLVGLFGRVNKHPEDVVVAETMNGPVIGTMEDAVVETSAEKGEPIAEAAEEVADEVDDAVDVGSPSSAGRHAAPPSE